MQEILDSVNWNLILPILLIQLVLVVTALTSCIRAPKTNGPKLMWVLIILFVNTLGPVLYFVVGRRNE